MANVFFPTRTGVSLNDLPPGGEESWIYWGFNYGDFVLVTAHPLVAGEERILSVINLQTECTPDGGRRVFFTVRNDGNSDVNYAVFAGYVTP